MSNSDPINTDSKTSSDDLSEADLVKSSLWNNITMRYQPPIYQAPAQPQDLATLLEQAHRKGELEPPAPAPTITGPSFGLEKRHYFYTDELGEIVVFKLASFKRRALGAGVDFLVVIVAVLLFYSTLKLFVIQIAVNSIGDAGVAFVKKGSLEAAKQAAHDRLEQALTAFNTLSVAVEVMLLLFIICPFVYHTLFLGLTAQTPGHRFARIKVVKLNNEFISVRSALLRTFYGTLPQLLAVLLVVLVSGLFGLVLGFIINLLVLLGIASAAFNPTGQGWHDRLAFTYVISTI